ncbi:lipopolysaccharide/colanic/teichoic acid biosynthesis glycosyltransferase [Actinoplanes octamycinicus]|uniref:Lipopolysaccharide/colanic/teichoic acid biosynthesis glycosyltransferase n=1 Tax=Actinoplanes octamycinicus TaxID=135948 RepID=A0A7W7H6L7_9ACTN|nr:sugar transferase [Actinoplanes octamycinicus]MBB4744965.1 lipopolysaccharide/colanic/teichoic acid biosynthesis glycosyltransferase [Actinoplanes octamycinicus]GIE55551.1 sugar transferase [Actinoplanes octamycinicus]
MDRLRPIWNVLNQLVAAVALILLSPVFLGVALWIRIADGKGVFFVQDRAGRGGRTFRILKFRSMIHDNLAVGARLGMANPNDLLADDPRITRCGRILRATSLDELPQLINVVRGQMNLVGPRPDVLPQVAEYSAQDARRLEVRPGITGWAQINGRDAIPWSERFVLDRWYIDNWSPLLDLRIIWRTFQGSHRGERPALVETLPAQRTSGESTQDLRRAA